MRSHSNHTASQGLILRDREAIVSKDEAVLTSVVTRTPLRSRINREIRHGHPHACARCQRIRTRILRHGSRASYTPGAPFDGAIAHSVAQNYDARVIRDHFGVPHIYGKRNADVAYGLAYAHAEDDWKTIEEVIRSSRGTLSEIVGDSGAKSDDLILALGNTEIVNRDYDAKASPKSKAVAEAYAAGLNVFCADHPDTGCARTMPVTGRDIMAGFVNRPMSFYGFEGEVDSLLSGRANMEMSTKSTRQAFIDTHRRHRAWLQRPRCRPEPLRRRPHPPRRQLAPAL